MAGRNCLNVNFSFFIFLAFFGWNSATNGNTEAQKPFPVSSFKTLSTLEFFKDYTSHLYSDANLGASDLDSLVFFKAITGFYNLKAAGKIAANSTMLTIIDFTKSSRTKRMWIIDLQRKLVLLNTWVAHGMGSGEDMADRFSNIPESYQSSLGFYVTDQIYNGKHGRSLRLEGLDEGFNTRASERAIVIHSASYVSQAFINQEGRLGRSQGCPAVSPDVIDDVIEDLKGRTVVFANGNDPYYTSHYLDQNTASAMLMRDGNSIFNTASL